VNEYDDDDDDVSHAKEGPRFPGRSNSDPQPPRDETPRVAGAIERTSQSMTFVDRRSDDRKAYAGSYVFMCLCMCVYVCMCVCELGSVVPAL
jgi:hypothetical protein